MQIPATGGANWTPGSEKELDVTNVLSTAGDNKSLNVVSDDPAATYAAFASQFAVAEAAGGVVSNPAGEVLMIFRKGVWDLPKGHLEDCETIGRCAVREVEEECGIGDITLGREICITRHIHCAYGTWEIKQTTWYAMTIDRPQTPTPQTEEDIEQAQWMSREQCVAAAQKSYATIGEVINKFYNIK